MVEMLMNREDVATVDHIYQWRAAYIYVHHCW
jgi:hypothetical protein